MVLGNEGETRDLREQTVVLVECNFRHPNQSAASVEELFAAKMEVVFYYDQRI